MQKKFLHTSCIAWAVFGCFMFFSFFISAQTTVNISANSGTSGGSTVGNSNYHVSESIYTAAELGSNFITTADAISAISLTCSTAATANTTVSNYKIYLKEVSAATTTLAVGIYSTSGYTLVYNGSMDVSTVGAKLLVLTTPFTRTSSTLNLQMLIERTNNLTHTANGFATANGNSTSGTVVSSRRYNSTVAPVSGTTSLSTATAFRPAIILQHLVANDLAVQQVYTLGKIPIPYASPHIIKANIVNNSLTSKTVSATLNVSGANTFSDVQSVTLLPGANTTVSFLGFSPTILGTNTVVVSIPSDANTANNSLSVSQIVSGNAYTYAYGTTNNGGVGFNTNTGDFVAKFSTSSATTVNQAQVNFTSGGNTYKIGIWSATAAGIPNTLLWESATQTTATGINTVPVSPPVAVSGDFFVGVRQTSTTGNVGFAYQTETPIRPTTFYFTSPSGGTTWTDFAPNNSFKFMIEPKLTLSDDVALTNAVPLGGSNIELCGPISPAITLANLGVNIQSNTVVTCNLKQGTTVVYTNTQTVASVASGASQVVSFGTYTAAIGAYTAEFVATLASDLDNSNNTVTSNFNVVQNNFGTTPTYKYANVYACPATTPTPAPTYNWITQTTNEITWTNALTANGGALADDDFSILTIPFNFSFYGTPYTSAYVSSNGWLSFTDPSALTAAQHRVPVTIPAAGGLENFIAGAWKDLDMNPANYADTHVYYGGDATQFVITFWHAHNYTAVPVLTDYVTFQIILKPDGSVKLQYNDAESTLPLPPTNITNSCTIGMENATGSEGVKYRYLTTGGPMFGSPMAVDMLLVTPLPLSLLSFDAKNNGAKNDLVWRTASEVNVSHFSVERSNDGVKYQEITKITANNDRNKTSTYTCSDALPLSGNNYYRLKIMDRDGKFEYSNIEVVNTKLPITNVKIYPNPVSNSLYSSFDLSFDNDCELQIFDTFGKLVASKSLDAQKGRNNTSIDVTNLAAGVYFVKINIDGVPFSVDKFVKD